MPSSKKYGRVFEKALSYPLRGTSHRGSQAAAQLKTSFPQIPSRFLFADWPGLHHNATYPWLMDTPSASLCRPILLFSRFGGFQSGTKREISTSVTEAIKCFPPLLIAAANIDVPVLKSCLAPASHPYVSKNTADASGFSQICFPCPRSQSSFHLPGAIDTDSIRAAAPSFTSPTTGARTVLPARAAPSFTPRLKRSLACGRLMPSFVSLLKANKVKAVERVITVSTIATQRWHSTLMPQQCHEHRWEQLAMSQVLQCSAATTRTEVPCNRKNNSYVLVAAATAANTRKKHRPSIFQRLHTPWVSFNCRGNSLLAAAASAEKACEQRCPLIHQQLAQTCLLSQRRVQPRQDHLKPRYLQPAQLFRHKNSPHQHQRLLFQQHLFPLSHCRLPACHHQPNLQQDSRRAFSSGFPNTKKRITNPFWRRTGWWDWRRKEVGKLNKARARRRHLWPRVSPMHNSSPLWDHTSATLCEQTSATRNLDAADTIATPSGTPAVRFTAAPKAGEQRDVSSQSHRAAVAAARAAAAADAAAAAVSRCTRKMPPNLFYDLNGNSGRRVVLPVEGARQRPFWRESRQKLLKQHRKAVSEAEAAARSAAVEEDLEQEREYVSVNGFDSSETGISGRRSRGRGSRLLRLTQQDMTGVQKGRGRVWEERKDGIPLGKKRLLLYCRLIKGAQITDAIDWLSTLCIHRVNYLVNLLLRTRQKIHEEGGDVSRVYISSYMLNIQGRVKRLQFRLRMVNFIKTWKFAVIIRCRELPLDEFFHRLFILKKVPRSLTTDMRLAIVEKRVSPTVIREWYPYLDATTRFWHRHEVPPVLPAAGLIDVCLSKTQRKTPTEIHRKSKLGAIKKFYMRKIKFCAQAFAEKFREIVDGFPKLDNIHPFYGDLLNILYDRDHYKLALGMIATTSRRIEKIAKEYVTLCKYADSLYKCKSLKVAALGRMCTLVKKLGQPLQYLEEARQHMSRLPSINPVARTLLLTGYPNVGKSSFINRISHANVDVQPFAFTTKSLFVGHFDYMYTRWQVIDTPGILDHPLEERNVIEMVAITALTHIQSTILYLLDLSEECGYSIEMQVSLFHSLGVLFKNKDVVVVLNKTDKVKLADLLPERQQLIRDMGKDKNVEFAEVSTLTGIGVDEAKNKACEMLLKRKVEQKLLLLSGGGKTAGGANAVAKDLAALGLEDKMYITTVATPREPFIPASVLKQRMQQEAGISKDLLATQRVLEKDLMEEHGGAGVYSVDLRKKYILAKEEWRYDVVPEFLNGHNVRDFVDEDIEEKLRLLEEEEERLLEEQEEERPQLEEQLDSMASLKMEMATLHAGLKRRRLLNMLKKKRNGPRLLKRPNSRLAELRKERKARASAHMGEPAGVDSAENARNEKDGSRKRGRSVERSERHSRSSARAGHASADAEEDARLRLKKKIRAMSRSRSVKPTARQRAASSARFIEKEEKISAAELGELRRLGGMEPRKARKLKIASDRRIRGRAGEADRRISVKMPKHLFAGKRSNGKTDRR